MNEDLSPTGIILEVLGDLELPLIKPIRETDSGFEVMVKFPDDRKYSKDILYEDFTNKKLKVISIDAFREKNEHYAWAIVKPAANEVENG